MFLKRKSSHLYSLIGIKGVIAENCWPRQLSFLLIKKSNRKKYGTARANMSTVMNEGVDIHCKAVTTQLFTLVGLLVELGTAIEKSKGSL